MCECIWVQTRSYILQKEAIDVIIDFAIPVVHRPSFSTYPSLPPINQHRTMSFRPGLLPNLLRSTRSQPFTSTFSRSFHRSPPPQSRILALTRPTLRFSPLLFPLALGGTYLTYNSLTSPVKCESPFPSLSTGPKPEVGAGEVPQSEISGYTLGFGAVCGICTGIFVKKGLKAIAFLLGGVFIFMQVSHSSRSTIPICRGGGEKGADDVVHVDKEVYHGRLE